jgi:hypothetical protein
MNTKVKVTSRNGQVVVPSKNNLEYGYVTVSQTRVIVDNGFIKKKDLTALMQGELEDLNSLNLYDGMDLPGNIYIKESLTPFREDDPEKDIKYAGDTGVICMVEDKPIFRKTMYSMQDESDEFVAHTNTEEIKTAQKSGKSAETANVEEEESFDL